MASLLNFYTNEIILLNAYHQIGRTSQNNTCIKDNDISRNHAVICWEESSWKLMDHSKNGTIIDSRIICQASKELRKGNIIQFGSNKSTIWKVLDTNPPCSYLKSRSKRNCFIDLSLSLIWPDDEHPEVSFYKTAYGFWEADLGNENVELKNGSILTLGSEEWEYVENDMLSSTSDLNDISKYACFVFNVSPDEEKVGVKIVINDLHLDLGGRVYNHVLLRLVRQRESDAATGYSADKQGWVTMEEMTNYLSKELLTEVDEYYLNVQIHRLRKKLMELSPYGYLFSNVIERKYGELRFSHPVFKIEKEDKIAKNSQHAEM
jgi:hypothetical protein